MKLFQVDAFTHEPFRGNPAAVCILEKEQPEAWMQSVAAEMNLSETAFVSPPTDPFSRAFQLRWFTPAVEVDLCGHATLATAHILWTEGYLKPTDEARFDTRSGRLTASMANPGHITLNFPAKEAVPAEPPAGLLQALKVENPVFIGRSEFDYLLELESAEQVISLKPDMSHLSQIEARGIIITAAGNEEFDIVSRFFGPAVGVPEDPVTGSAHCTLGPYWAKKLNKKSLNALQASARSGSMIVEIDGERVKLTGQAVTILRGELFSRPQGNTISADKRQDRKFTFDDD